MQQRGVGIRRQEWRPGEPRAGGNHREDVDLMDTKKPYQSIEASVDLSPSTEILRDHEVLYDTEPDIDILYVIKQ